MTTAKSVPLRCSKPVNFPPRRWRLMNCSNKILTPMRWYLLHVTRSVLATVRERAKAKLEIVQWLNAHQQFNRVLTLVSPGERRPKLLLARLDALAAE